MENLNDLMDWTKRKMFIPFKGKFVVYKFTNVQNGKVYIGITDWVNKRIGDHIRYSKNKNSKCRMYFHKAISKYGPQSFTFEIIDTAQSREELNLKEIYWIGYYNSSNSRNGYNLTSGGNSNVPNYETTQKRIKASKKVKVAQYTLQGDFIQSFDSVMEASRQLNIPNNDIHRCHNKNLSRNKFMFRKFKDTPPNKLDPYVSNTGKNLSILNRGKLPHNAVSCSAENLKTGEVYYAETLLELSNKLKIHRTTIFRILKNNNHKKWKITLEESL